MPARESRKRKPFACLALKVINIREKSRMAESKIILLLFPLLGTAKGQPF